MRVTAVGILLFGLLATPGLMVTARARPPEQEDVKSADKNVEAANKLFPCPKAKWDVVKQPFWRHHAILKLRSCQWPHRPTVVVDEQGKAHLITDDIQIIPEKPTLDEFNEMAKRETVEINVDNAADYLYFFINAHLNSRDRLYFGDHALEQKAKALWLQSDAKRLSEETDHLKAELASPEVIPVTEINEHHDFKATVFKWSPDWIRDTYNPPGIER
jgi:hypothetical protein